MNIKSKSNNNSVVDWSSLINQLVDKVSGKDMSVTYQFNNVQIDLPQVMGPSGQEFGSAQLRINGNMVIKGEINSKT